MCIAKMTGGTLLGGNDNRVVAIRVHVQHLRRAELNTDMTAFTHVAKIRTSLRSPFRKLLRGWFTAEDTGHIIFSNAITVDLFSIHDLIILNLAFAKIDKNHLYYR
jgi:3D (Asp-Asp-Asp) domain-containing protein